MIFCVKTIFILGLIFVFPSKYTSSHIDEPFELVTQNEINDFVIGETQNIDFSTEESEPIDFSTEKSEPIDFSTEESEHIDSILEKTKSIELGFEENAKNDSVTEEIESIDFDFFKVFHKAFFDSIKPYIYEHYPFRNVNENCSDHLSVYFNALEVWEPWAVMMFDATGKIPDGFLGASVMEFGSLDDCVEIKISQPFQPQFCTVGIEFPILKPIQQRTTTGKKYVEAYGRPAEWFRRRAEEELIISKAGVYMGTCLPSFCSEQDLHTIVHSMTKSFNPLITVSNCQVDKHKEMESTTKIAIAVLILLLTVIAAGTAMDLSDQRQRKENIIRNKTLNREMLKAFSVYTNARKLFEINENDIGAVHLLKVFLCMMVIFAHNLIYPLSWREMRYDRMINYFVLTNWKLVVFDQAFFIVDIFFVLGGILLAIGVWKELEKTGGKLNIPFIIFKKYMRFTPSQIVLIALLYVGPIFNSGVIWNDTWGYEIEKCNKYGWKNLFHIQNFRGNEEMCQIQTWYIAATMQQYFIVLPLMVLIYRHLKSGLILATLLLIGCTVHDFIRSVQTEMLFTAFSKFRIMEGAYKFSHHIYYFPMHHLSTTIFGMAVGVLLCKIKDTKIRKIFQVYQKPFKIMATVSLLVAYYASYYPTKDFRIMALYNSTRTIFFGFGVSWFIYSAIMNATSKKEGDESTKHDELKQTNQKPVPNFSPLKEDLKVSSKSSQKSFTLAILSPFSKITFSTYLFHPLTLILRDAVLQDKFHMGIINILVELVLLNTLSFGIGIFGYLVVENPFNKAFDLWVKRDQFIDSPTRNDDKFYREKAEDREKEL